MEGQRREVGGRAVNDTYMREQAAKRSPDRGKGTKLSGQIRAFNVITSGAITLVVEFLVESYLCMVSQWFLRTTGGTTGKGGC